MRIVSQAGYECLKNGTDFALCVIVEKTGSTPREVGASMLVSADGRSVGTVGGGLVELGTQRRAQKVLKEKKATRIHFDLSNEDAGDMGMICGGDTDVWIDYVDASNPYLDIYKAMTDVYHTGMCARFGIYPELDSEVHQCLLLADGTVYGAYVDDAGSLISGVTQFQGYDVFTVSEQRRLLLRRIGSEAKAIIFGGGHVGLQLAPIVHALGFETVVIDDRAEFANNERFPYADRVLALDTLTRDVFMHEPCDANTFVIILTRGHSFDRDVLEQTLITNARYIGMIGSRPKRDKIYEYLYKKGFTKDDIARVYSPIGVDIGAQTPEEIAVSIAAELIRVRRRGE